MPTLKQLEYFCELARTGNMTKLAESHYVSQTALSNAISRLENDLGVPLFNRIGRNIVLNEYGLMYYQYIEPAMGSFSLAQQAIDNLKKTNSQSVSIAIASSTLWGTMIGSFLRENPELSLSQRECNIDTISKSLPNLDVDLIIAGSIDFDSPYLDSIKFISDAVRLYVPLNHPFANRKSIRLIEAKDENYICQPPNTGFSQFCNKLFDQAGFKPKIVAECDYTLRRDLLRSGVGVVLASDTILRARFFDNCIPILVEDDFAVRDMSCFWLKNRALSPSAKKFRDFLVSYYANEANR